MTRTRMDIGILGAGTMGAALAVRLARSGHEVLVGTRDPRKDWPYPHISLGSYQAAAEFGDLTILALPWPVGLEVLGCITLRVGQILVDVSNPETPDGRGLLLAHHNSGAEEIARAAPQARIIKAFSHFYAELLHEDTAFDDEAPSVIYCGDDVEAKECVGSMIASCGLDAVDAGGLTMARYLEPFAMLTVGLVRDQGWGPTGVAWRLMRRRG